MKRRITTEQLQELTQGQKAMLHEWWKPKTGDCYATNNHEFVYSEYRDNEFEMGHMLERNALPLLSIGQMVEFLEDELEDNNHYCEIRWCKHEELCDVLWQMTKESLSRM